MENSVLYLSPATTATADADLRLMAQVQLGDPTAQALLVDRVLNQVRRTASYLACGQDDAQDLAQSALIRILHAAGDYRGESSIEYWAERITVHTCAKEFEKNRRRRGLFEKSHSPPRQVVGAEEKTEAYRARYRLAALLGTLDIKIRTAVVLHYLDGYSIQETADLTAVPVNTVRGRLREGRKKLKKKILSDPLLSVRVKET